MFAGNNAILNLKDEKVETSRYYDIVIFAKLIEAPSYFSWGYNDPTCPPTSYYSAYKVIRVRKQVFVAPNTGHWRTKEQVAWIIN